MSTNPPWDDVEVLAEPTRRRAYDAVRAAAEPVTREQVADALGITVRLAAFHLDRLADAGLLAVDYARPAGRGGPGAGRPSKRYAPAGRVVEVSVPPRRANVVARVLATAVATAPHDAQAAALATARAEGEQLGAEHRGRPGLGRRAVLGRVARTLDALGYEPVTERSRLRLRNCPFHDVVDVAPGLVCQLNHALLSGVLAGLGADGDCVARGDGVPPDCCVSVYPSDRPGAASR